jgi:hypothetical protein
MAPGPISMKYSINHSHQCVCLYLYLIIVARQRLVCYWETDTEQFSSTCNSSDLYSKCGSYSISHHRGYPEWAVSCFSSVSPVKWRYSISNYVEQDDFLPNPFHFIIHYHLTIRHYIVWAPGIILKQAIKNKKRSWQSLIYWRNSLLLWNGNNGNCVTVFTRFPPCSLL